MTAMRPDLERTASALFAGAPDWTAIAESGLPRLLVPEAAGGFGGDWGDAEAVLRLAGAAALAQPLAEAMLAARLLAAAGVALPAGRVTIAIAQGRVTDGRFTGSAPAVPWGGASDAVLAAVGGELLLLPPGVATPGLSPAGEPRDRLDWQGAAVLAAGRASTSLGKSGVGDSAASEPDLLALAGWARAAQVAGALGAALDLAVDHVNTRVQFGKPLARQQAVQQQLAVLASEVAAAGMASAAAAAALDAGGDASLALAAAKLRANLAIGRGVAIAHQVHGAIGFTRDYPLQLLTRRLMGWRSEFGSEGAWADRLGALAVARGSAGLWATITG